MNGDVPRPGTVVWIRRQRWCVRHAKRHGQVVRLDVTHHDRRLTFLTPFDRLEKTELRTRPRYARPAHAMARLAGVIARNGSVRAPLSLVDARLEILPHQIEPVLAVLGGVRRLLIADEVGLGKTIQAGLVIAELQRRTPSIRVLVILPAALSEQWQQELDRRFGITSDIVRQRFLEDAVRAGPRGTNPWTRAGVWLASVDYLKQPHVFGAMPRVPWDLVVIDEAHDACGDSDRHDACTHMARRARRVVLLTATPHSGDVARFARLESIGALERIDDPLIIFRRTRAELALSTTRAVRWSRVSLSNAELEVLDTLAAFEVRALNVAAAHRREDAALLLLSVFRKRALSTMAALDVSIGRRLLLGDRPASSERETWSQPCFDFGNDDDVSKDDQAGLTADIGLGTMEERLWLHRLRRLARAAAGHESKIARVRRLVSRTREPLVIFTEFRHSLIAIERHLARSRHLVALHGGQTAAERRHALDQFLSGQASVLLATDIAAQGLNLQHRARWVVSFELPWNPVRLEQRIGRVDRIGQTRSVHATLLIARHTAETGVLSRLAARTLNAQRAFGGDILRDAAPPPALSMARALISGSDDESRVPAGATLRSSETWRRSARAVASQTVARRTLARQWRPATAPGRRPMWTVSRRSACPNSSSFVVLSIPLIDGTGTAVETVFCGARIAGVSRTEAVRLARSTELGEVVSRLVRARMRRVTRLLADRGRAAARVEEAIAACLSAGRLPAELQPGLFDRREVRAFDVTKAELEDLARRAAATVQDLRSTRLEAGKPTIELIVCAG